MEIQIIILLSSIVLSAFFSGIEISFYQANLLEVEVEKKKGSTRAGLVSYFSKNQSDFITATLIGNNIAIVIYGIVFTKLIDFYYGDSGIFHIQNPFLSFVVITIVSTFIILLIAEFIPKAVFRLMPNKVLEFLIFPYWIFYIILFPVKLIVELLARLILFVMGIKVKDKKNVLDFIDLFHFVDKRIRQNKNNDLEIDKKMIQNVIELPNLKVRECMVPRTELAALEVNDSIENLKTLFEKSGHSKVVIYEENIDNVLGFVHVIDLYTQPDSIKNILRPIIIIAESMPANKLLKQFMDSKRSLGLVVDEYGGTAGLVTIEDILEEIFGEIEDEFDRESLKEVVVSDNEYIFSARLEIDYLNDKYNFGLPEGDYATLGGYLLELFEKIPKTGNEISQGPNHFKIVSATGNRINEIYLTRQKS